MEKPDLSPRKMRLEASYVNRLLGTEFSPEEIAGLLERMRFGARTDGEKIIVSVPAYRTDILHPIDLVEDAAIAYGYMKFKPQEDGIKLGGKLKPETEFANKLREGMLGMGFSEALTLIMTNKRDLFERTLVTGENIVEAESAVSSEHSVCRNWLLPSLLKVLCANKNHEYPQRFFEVGLCLDSDGGDVRKISGVMAHAKTNFSEIKSVVLGLYESVGVEHKTKASNHPSFIAGRCAQTKEGFYGEIHPQVLENYALEVPVTAFEFDTGKLGSNS